MVEKKTYSYKVHPDFYMYTTAHMQAQTYSHTVHVHIHTFIPTQNIKKNAIKKNPLERSLKVNSEPRNMCPS